MGNLKKLLAGVWFLWRNRKHLAHLRAEILDVWIVSKKALKDKVVTKEETVQILKELDDVIPVVLKILGG